MWVLLLSTYRYSPLRRCCISRLNSRLVNLTISRKFVIIAAEPESEVEMSILGTLAVIASLTIVVIGLPQQIYKNYRQKSCEGLASSLVYSAFCTYTLWGLYGWTTPDYFLAISQTPGSVITLILVFQLFYYGRNRAQR